MVRLPLKFRTHVREESAQIRACRQSLKPTIQKHTNLQRFNCLKHIRTINLDQYNTFLQKRDYHILFCGTDHFALEVLKSIHKDIVLKEVSMEAHSEAKNSTTTSAMTGPTIIATTCASSNSRNNLAGGTINVSTNKLTCNLLTGASFDANCDTISSMTSLDRIFDLPFEKQNTKHTLHIVTPPNSVHKGEEIIHPVKQYAMDHGLYFVDIPHEKRWPKDENCLRRLVGKSVRVSSSVNTSRPNMPSFHGGDESSFNHVKSSEIENVNLSKMKNDNYSKGNLVFETIPQEDVPPHFDIGIVVSFRYLVPNFIVNQFKIGAFNIHPSDLPKYRGPAPIAWTIANGEVSTRISFIQLVSKFDHGNIVYQSNDITIPSDEMYSSLHARLAKISACMTKRFLIEKSNDELKTILNVATFDKSAMPSTTITTNVLKHANPSNTTNTTNASNSTNETFHTNPTSNTETIIMKSPNAVNVKESIEVDKIPFAPKISQAHCRVSFITHTSTEIFNRWRAFSENGKIYTTYKGKVLYLLNIGLLTHLSDDKIHTVRSRFENDAHPGETTFDKRNKLVYIQCKDRRSIVLKVSQFSGRKQTNSSGFAAGLSLRNFERAFLHE